MQAQLEKVKSYTRMVENRRVRFSSIEGIERADLPWACEVWREDVFRAPWAERNDMKLAMLFTRYIVRPDPQMVLLHEIEQLCQLRRDESLRALSVLQAFGAVDSYTLDGDDLRIYLNLTMSQRLRVLEMKNRFHLLAPRPREAPVPPVGGSLRNP